MKQYTIDKNILKRFDQRNTVFSRVYNDPSSDFYKKNIYENITEIIEKKKEKYSIYDFVLHEASWSVANHFKNAYSHTPLEKDHFISNQIIDATILTEELKKAALLYGAGLVGVCKINKDWLYSHNIKGNIIKLPKSFKYAVVLAIPMNAENIKESPSFIAAAATGEGYSRSAYTTACVSEYIRNFGYNAIPSGNDIGLSIPLAVDAGLGEMGRNGMLITKKYGSCVRICKIFTDIPLVCDKPVDLNVQKFCKKCGLCAKKCHSKALSTDPDPSFKTMSISNNPGVFKWPVNAEKCYSFWIENGCDCSTCIAVCPFFKKAFRHI